MRACVIMCVMIFGDFYEGDMRRPHPLFPLVIFQLGFSGIPEIHERMRNRIYRNDPAGPCFGTLAICLTKTGAVLISRHPRTVRGFCSMLLGVITIGGRYEHILETDPLISGIWS